MPESETVQIEVPTKELSDATVEELFEEDIFDEDQEETIRNRIYLQEMTPEANPTKVTTTEATSTHLSNIYGYFAGKINRIRNKTTYGVISEVTPVDETTVDLTIKFETQNTKRSPAEIKSEDYRVYTNTVEYANLLEYHQISNAQQLVGKKLVRVYKPNRDVNPRFYIPHNTSKSGKLRYKAHGLVSDALAKLRLDSVSRFCNNDEGAAGAVTTILGIILLIISVVVVEVGYWVNLLSTGHYNLLTIPILVYLAFLFTNWAVRAKLHILKMLLFNDYPTIK